MIARNAHQRTAPLRVARRFGRLEGCRGALLGSLAIALLLGPFPARAEGPTARVSFAAPFALEMGGRGPVERSSGTVAFLPDGSVCIRVASPIQQELHFAHDKVVVFYPDRDLALRSKVEPGAAPPLLDAVLAGVVDPASTIPKTSKMLEQKRHGEELRTRWKLIDAEGRDLGEMRTVETRGGVTSVELVARSGKTQRHLTFAERGRHGGHRIARVIDARYYDGDGKLVREEKWRLGELRATEPADARCAQLRATTKVEELDL